MINEAITKAVSNRICDHMNRDHMDSLIKYAKYFGGIATPENVKMLEITSKEMNLRVDGELSQISFDHEIKSSSDAHETLVAMIKHLPILE